MADQGIIYIFKHKIGQNVKVGETSISAEERLKDYTRKHKLEGFEFHKQYEVPLKARKQIEKIAHDKLQKWSLFKSKGPREIFACTPKEAEIAIEEAIKQSKIYSIEKEKEERERKRQESAAKRKAEYDKAKAILEKKLESEWRKSNTFNKLEKELENLPEALPEYEGARFLYILFLFYCVLIWIRTIGENGFSIASFLAETIIFILLLAPFLWLNSKAKKNIGKNTKHYFIKIGIEEEIKIQKKKYFLPKLAEFESSYHKRTSIKGRQQIENEGDPWIKCAKCKRSITQVRLSTEKSRFDWMHSTYHKKNGSPSSLKNKIIVCSICGQKNRIPNGYEISNDDEI